MRWEFCRGLEVWVDGRGGDVDAALAPEVEMSAVLRLVGEELVKYDLGGKLLRGVAAGEHAAARLPYFEKSGSGSVDVAPALRTHAETACALNVELRGMKPEPVHRLTADDVIRIRGVSIRIDIPHLHGQVDRQPVCPSLPVPPVRALSPLLAAAFRLAPNLACGIRGLSFLFKREERPVIEGQLELPVVLHFRQPLLAAAAVELTLQLQNAHTPLPAQPFRGGKAGFESRNFGEKSLYARTFFHTVKVRQIPDMQASRTRFF